MNKSVLLLTGTKREQGAEKPSTFSLSGFLWWFVALPGKLKHYDCNKKPFYNQVP
jgi:hypothetical protein